MTKTGIYSPDQRPKEKLASLNKLATAEVKKTKTLIYVPPIGEELPTPAALQNFTITGNDVWTVGVKKFSTSL